MAAHSLRWDDVVCASALALSSPVCDQIAILGLDQEVYRSPVGRRVWELVRRPIAVSEVHRRIVEECGLDEETARRDVLDLLDRLLGAALVEVRSAS